MATIYLTDQIENQHPNIKDVSREILFSVAGFYDCPEKAENIRKLYSPSHKLAEDSGGFQFLMGRISLDQCDPIRTVDLYKRIGVTRKDFPIQLDLPPQFQLSKKQRMKLIRTSAQFYHQMTQEIDWVIPVVHGWTSDELLTSLNLIEDPDLLASGSYIATSARNQVGAGTNYGAQYDWIMGKMDSSRPRNDRVATPNNAAPPATLISDHVNPRKPIAAGANSIFPSVVDNVISSHPRIIGAGAFQQSGDWVCDRLANTKSRQLKRIAVGANQQSGRYVLNEAGSLKKTIATPQCVAEQCRQKTPLTVIWERLAFALNLLRNRELFILGAASPNDTHILFLGGAKYGDTSSWRLKAYLAEIYVPERGSVCVGYKGSPKPKEEDLRILRECLRESSHPLSGMSLETFLTVAKMNMAEWRATLKQNKWPVKPFDLRALHNAWVLKHREQQIANEYTNDPDRYYYYLKCRRFKGHPNLIRKLEFLWSRFKRPYVQDSMDIFLKTR